MREDITKKVLKEIQPSHNELKGELKFANAVLRELRGSSPKGSAAVLAGSVAKGTFLRNDRDIDVFILLPKSVPKKDFEGILKKIVHNAFPKARYELKYAEHPYLRLFLEHVRVDVVPAYRIRHAGERMSAVDRSILHTAFIRKKLKQAQIKEVLLLKKFMKSAELYGAEIKTEGFSGYLCELLVMRYGSFPGCIKAMARWKMPITMQLGKAKNRKSWKKTPVPVEALFSAPLVFPDPTDQFRNVAAGVSEGSIKKVILLSRRFLKHKSEKYFAPPQAFEKKLSRITNEGNAVIVKMRCSDATEDILWGQLKKLHRQLLDYLERHEFRAQKSILGIESGDATIAIRFRLMRLSTSKNITGPLLSMKQHVAQFRKSHRGARFSSRDGHIEAKVKRDIDNAKKALMTFFSKVEMPSHLGNKSNVRISFF